MVTAVTSFGRSGLYDWLIQRVTSVALVAYILCIMSFLLANPDLQYEQWKAFFDNLAIRIFSLLALISLGAHAWIGLWSVLTDYITVRLMGPKATALRLFFQCGCGLLMFAYLFWGIQILWGI